MQNYPTRNRSNPSSQSTTSSRVSSNSTDTENKSHARKSSLMGFFTSKRDLERTRIEKENLERQLEERTEEAARRRIEEKTRLERERRIYREELAKLQALEDARAQQRIMQDIAIENTKQKRKEKLRKMKEASPDTLRNLRELIRNRYQMDVEIWSLRSARKPDRPKVVEKMVVADAILEEILTTISTWGSQRDGNWTDEEWERVVEIKERLQSEGKRVWMDNPPWGGGSVGGGGGGGGGGTSNVGRRRTDGW